MCIGETDCVCTLPSWDVYVSGHTDIKQMTSAINDHYVESSEGEGQSPRGKISGFAWLARCGAGDDDLPLGRSEPRTTWGCSVLAYMARPEPAFSGNDWTRSRWFCVYCGDDWTCSWRGWDGSVAHRSTPRTLARRTSVHEPGKACLAVDEARIRGACNSQSLAIGMA